MIPSDANLSNSARDLICKLISDSSERLGINGVEEIKAHPFFFGIEWRNIRKKKSWNIPEIKSEVDHDLFDKFEEDVNEPWIGGNGAESRNNKRNRNVFIFISYFNYY